MQQIAGGLAGAIIVAGDFDELPGIAGLPSGCSSCRVRFWDQAGCSYLVNGQPNPTIAIRPGETQRWRILNASANAFFNLRLDGHQLHRLAADGKPLPASGPSTRCCSDQANAPTCWCKGGGAATTRCARGLGRRRSGPARLPGRDADVAGRSGSAGATADTIMPLAERRRLDERPHRPPADRHVTKRSHAPYFAIDGLGFDPDRVDQIVKLGATEEWVVRNTSPDWHPFHIHVNDFQVISVNGEPQAPHYEDTVLVPRNGEVVIRMRFLDFTGKFVYHCHILAHEDGGMMGVVEVVDSSSIATPRP